MNGKLIVIEGLDGSGKSTQVNLLRKRLQKDGVDIKQIKLPDYESDSSALVKMYLAGKFGSHPEDVNIYASSLFYAVDRYASFKTSWGNDYSEGKLILADRYTTSNAVHQTVKLPKDQWDAYLQWLFEIEYGKVGIPKPDAVIFLDMDVDISQKLMSGRYSGVESKKDVHEADVSYLKNCHEAALYVADKYSWNVIKCYEGDDPLPIDTIADKIYETVKNVL